MVAARPKVRLYVEQGLAMGAAVELGADQAHYLLNVMRLGRGDAVALFNGRDGEWRAAIDGTGRGRCSVSVTGRIAGQTDVSDLWLVFAPVKRAPLDLMAQKATELGVAALWPVMTRHTAVSRVNIRRLRANVIEAAEQSGRTDVPSVFEPVPLAELPSCWPAERRVLVADESGRGVPILGALAGQPPGPWAVLVGPEGGFAPDELDALNELPFVTRIGLGPRILRAETAALAALACWQASLGDWRAAGRPPVARPSCSNDAIGSG